MKKSNLILFIILNLIVWTSIILVSAFNEQLVDPSFGDPQISSPNFASNLQTFYFGKDFIAPVITLISPEQGTMDTDGVIRFIFNPTDNNQIMNCSLVYQGGIYTTIVPINDSENIIEVVGIDESNPLYLDNLQWRIDCTDLFNNVGSSETRNLDTKDITGGGGVTQAIIPSDRNPLYLNLFYQKVWNPNEENLLKIETFNQERELYEPQNIEFEYDDDLILKSLNISGESYAYFIPKETIKPGIYQIKIKVKDERTITQIIEFEIKGEYSYVVKSYKETLKKYQWYLYGIIIFLIIALICIFVIIDKRRKRRKKTRKNQY